MLLVATAALSFVLHAPLPAVAPVRAATFGTSRKLSAALVPPGTHSAGHIMPDSSLAPNRCAALLMKEKRRAKPSPKTEFGGELNKKQKVRVHDPQKPWAILTHSLHALGTQVGQQKVDVLLLQTVSELGTAGEIVTVGRAQLDNFLFPTGKARLARAHELAAPIEAMPEAVPAAKAATPATADDRECPPWFEAGQEGWQALSADEKQAARRLKWDRSKTKRGGEPTMCEGAAEARPPAAGVGRGRGGGRGGRGRGGGRRSSGPPSRRIVRDERGNPVREPRDGRGGGARC